MSGHLGAGEPYRLWFISLCRYAIHTTIENVSLTKKEGGGHGSEQSGFRINGSGQAT